MFPIKNLIQQKKNQNNNIQTNFNLQNQQNIYSVYRKTSAEIISEAKNMLAGSGGLGGGGLGGSFNGINNGGMNNPNNPNNTGNTMIGGARLVSTRRPITPREPKRQLYGKQAPPGRPPSSFSLRYLQFESRVLPSIEAIIQKTKSIKKNVHSRSGSLGGLINDNKNTLIDTSTSSLSPPSTTSSLSPPSTSSSGSSALSVVSGASASSSSGSSAISSLSIGNHHNHHHHHKLQGKLPALLLPPKLSGSLDNLSEEMPPRKDFKSKDCGNIQQLMIENKNNPNDKNIKKHKNNRKSFDNENMPPIEMNKNKHHKLLENNNRKQSINKTPIIFTKTLLIKSNDLLIQSSTETLLDLLKAHAGIKECTEETILHINGILNELYSRVKGASGDWRSAVLGALYGLVECTSPKILLSVARVVLVLCVTGSNLTGACKLVFKIARNEVNDHLFIDSDVPELLIDGLGRANPLEEPEACIYGYGAVRFLANASSSSSSICTTQKIQTTIKLSNKETTKNKSLAQRLARHGAIQLMILHLQMLNEAGATIKLVGPALHALFQLSGALRALANIPLQHTDSVLMNNGQPSYYSNNNKTTATTKSTNNNNNPNPKIKEIFDESLGGYQLDMAGSHLVRAAEICIGEAEVQANLIRTLSVLSENQQCCEVLSEYVARIGILLGPCTLNERDLPEKSLGVISRIGYILGNIMARFDSARLQFFTNDVAMEYLLDTLDKYAHKNVINNNSTSNNNNVISNNNKGNSNNNNGNDTTLIDVLIKLVRVIANMSVNPEVGYGLCTRQPLGGTLLTLMININNVKIDLSSEMEELLFATLGALHNLSFYQDTNQKDEQRIIVYSAGSIAERLNDLTESLCYTLMYGPKNAKSEVARVLGNMTRCPIVRQSLCSAGCLKVLVKNLESTDYELITTSCGVLVNLLGDWERRAPFREIKGPLLLRDVLQKSASHNDWLLAGIVCQAFWNYLIDSGNITDALGEDEADYISGDLAEYLDEETIFNGEQPDSMWEQFAVIATDLLERIQSSITYYNNDSSNNVSDDDDNDNDDGNDKNGTDENGNKINNRRCWQGHFKQWLEE